MRVNLSQREADVLALVAQGLCNKEVADKLFVTEKTVKFHLTSVYRKIRVKSRAEAIVQILRKQLDPVNQEMIELRMENFNATAAAVQERAKVQEQARSQEDALPHGIANECIAI